MKLQIVDIEIRNSALGDLICFFPIFKILIERGQVNNIYTNLNWLDFLKKVFPNQRFILRNENEMLKQRKSEYILCKTFLQTPNSINIPLIDWASLTLANCILKPEQKNYLNLDYIKTDVSKFKLPNNYIILTCGYTSELKKLNPIVFKEIKNYLISLGFSIVVLGKEGNIVDGSRVLKVDILKEYDLSNTINLVNKTSILESLRIISKAEFILGVDNGLLHLAGCTNTPIIAAYTHKDPYYLMPYRNNQLGYNVYTITPSEDVCRFCMTNYILQNHDYKYCDKGTFECCKSLTFEKFKEQIDKVILENKNGKLTRSKRSNKKL
jgi:hypothetical protein